MMPVSRAACCKQPRYEGKSLGSYRIIARTNQCRSGQRVQLSRWYWQSTQSASVDREGRKLGRSRRRSFSRFFVRFPQAALPARHPISRLDIIHCTSRPSPAGKPLALVAVVPSASCKSSWCRSNARTYSAIDRCFTVQPLVGLRAKQPAPPSFRRGPRRQSGGQLRVRHPSAVNAARLLLSSFPGQWS
jgi:hypothetical protein